MMKFDGITLISDMDGTLLTEEKTISKENLEAIAYFRKNGGNFTIASGRVYKSVSCYFDLLQPDLPVISHNGGFIFNPVTQEILHCEYLRGNYKQIAREIHEKYPWIGIEAFTASDILFLADNPYIRKHIQDENLFPDGNIRWYSLEEAPEQCCKMLFACETDDADRLEQELPSRYPAYSWVRSEAHYYEILPPGVNKGNAASKLMKLTGLPTDRFYAVGDNMNDAELLQVATVGVAVNNASDTLKEAADVILPFSNEEHAIAKLIEMIERGSI